MKKPIIITSLVALLGTGLVPAANAFATEREGQENTDLGSYIEEKPTPEIPSDEVSEPEIIIIDGVSYDLNGGCKPS